MRNNHKLIFRKIMTAFLMLSFFAWNLSACQPGPDDSESTESEQSRESESSEKKTDWTNRVDELIVLDKVLSLQGNEIVCDFSINDSKVAFLIGKEGNDFYTELSRLVLYDFISGDRYEQSGIFTNSSQAAMCFGADFFGNGKLILFNNAEIIVLESNGNEQARFMLDFISENESCMNCLLDDANSIAWFADEYGGWHLISLVDGRTLFSGTFDEVIGAGGGLLYYEKTGILLAFDYASGTTYELSNYSKGDLFPDGFCYTGIYAYASSFEDTSTVYCYEYDPAETLYRLEDSGIALFKNEDKNRVILYDAVSGIRCELSDVTGDSVSRAEITEHSALTEILTEDGIHYSVWNFCASQTKIKANCYAMDKDAVNRRLENLAEEFAAYGILVHTNYRAVIAGNGDKYRFDTAVSPIYMLACAEQFKLFFDAFSDGFLKELFEDEKVQLYFASSFKALSEKVEQHPQAVTYQYDGENIIVLNPGKPRVMIHEIFHSMQKRFIAEDLEGWAKLNPDGFRYWNSYRMADDADVTEAMEYTYAGEGNRLRRYFIDSYGKTYIYEDMAQIFENIFMGYNMSYFDAPQLLQKARYLEGLIELRFESVMDETEVVW